MGHSTATRFDSAVRLSAPPAIHSSAQAWARFKYTAHLDGITCSNKLEQTMAVGMLVFKEESGYRSFYHNMLRPYAHYVPFWRERPQARYDLCPACLLT